ncbi:hypothetical protein B0H13DRAFT_1604569 [Mycena leptocephala]|nr:hypothetical protein B0H13DRAFT_1604569 [Mycena leptocephala]
MEAAPPSYNSASSPSINVNAPAANEAPPAYSIPNAFAESSRSATGTGIEAFVDVPQIKDHLALLHAFAELKVSVERMTDEAGIPHLPTDNERRWGWFVGLAVERFEKWCKALQPSHSEKGLATILPPVDVLMIWHAYMLNPGWYAEDGERIETLKGLHLAGEAFTTALGGEFGELLASEPSKQRVDSWVQMTVTPFDPFESASQTVAKEIACPKCCVVLSAPFLTEKGTGYLQQGFAMECIDKKCAFEITRDTLHCASLRTIWPSRSRAKKHQNSSRKSPELLSIANGTIHTPTNVVDIARGQFVKDTMLSSSNLRRPIGSDHGTVVSDAAYANFLMEQAKYKLDTLRDILASRMKGKGGKLIGRIMSAYVDDKIFSVELIAAVLRQGSFVTKMYDLQWTKTGFFDNVEDEVALQHANMRYHAFLDLMSSSPGSFFVPTLDIDLAWHTHQLMARDYSKDTVGHVGRFIDQYVDTLIFLQTRYVNDPPSDDKVEESQLASSFDLTCGAWKNRFGVQYTCCGCPLPGKTIGQRLAHLVGHGTNPSYIVPPVRNGQVGKLNGSRSVQLDPAFLVPVPLYSKAACGSGCGGGCGMPLCALTL